MGIVICSKVVGYILFFCSCVFSVQLMRQFAVSGLDQAVWSLLGIGFMASEFIAAIVGIRLILHKRYGFAVIFIGLYCSLYLVSLFGTLGFESASSHAARQVSGNSDDKKILMQSSIEKIDAEIASLQSQAEQYAAKGYYTKAARPTLDRIEALNVERKEIYNSLMIYEPPGNNADAFWSELAKFFGSDNPNETRFLCFFLIAGLLDLTGACMVVLGARTFEYFIKADPDAETYFGIDPNEKRISQRATPEPVNFKAMSLTGDTGDLPTKEETPMKPLNDKEHSTPLSGLDKKKSDLVQEKEVEPDPVDMKPGPDPEPGFRIPGISPAMGSHKTAETAQAERVFGFTGRIENDAVKSPYSTVQVDAGPDDDEGDFPPEENPDDINPDDIEAYIKCAFKNRYSSGHFISRRYIGEKTSLGQAKADKIHVLLRDKGLVLVQNKKTFPACSEAEMLIKIHN